MGSISSLSLTSQFSINTVLSHSFSNLSTERGLTHCFAVRPSGSPCRVLSQCLQALFEHLDSPTTSLAIIIHLRRMRDSNPQGREAGSFQDCCITNYANPPNICKEPGRNLMNERKKVKNNSQKSTYQNYYAPRIRLTVGSDETLCVSTFEPFCCSNFDISP